MSIELLNRLKDLEERVKSLEKEKARIIEEKRRPGRPKKDNPIEG